MLGPDGAVGKRAVDLYAGTGSVGFDLLEHGAEHVDFVEIDRRRADEIRRLVRTKGFDGEAKVHRGDAVKFWSTLEGARYDIVFADPPYDVDPWNQIFEAMRNSAGLKPNAWIIAEHASRKPMPKRFEGANATITRKYGDSAITVYRYQDSTPNQR